jgi:hypothetical protein
MREDQLGPALAPESGNWRYSYFKVAPILHGKHVKLVDDQNFY